MITDRQKLIEEKIAASQMRRLRVKFLDALPAEARCVLEKAPFCCDSIDKFAPYFLATADGLGSPSSSRPHGYKFSVANTTADLADVLAELTDEHDSQGGWLRPFGAKAFSDQSMNEILFNELPVFEVTFGWARSNLLAIIGGSAHGAGVVSHDFSAGIIVHRVVGSGGDATGCGTVFEVGSWGVQRGIS